MDKKQLTEADIRTKFITPALAGTSSAKWNVMTQLREEVYFTIMDFKRATALFADPKFDGEADRRRAIDQRLADAHVTPLWYPDGEHEHVEQILELLLD